MVLNSSSRLLQYVLVYRVSVILLKHGLYLVQESLQQFVSIVPYLYQVLYTLALVVIVTSAAYE